MKKASTKDVYRWIYQNFQSFYRKALHELSFFDRIQGCVLQGCGFIKTLLHYRLFYSKKKLSLFFFKQLVFDTFPEKNILYSNVAVWKLQAYNFTERNSTIEVSLRIFQTFTINYFS